MSRTRRIFEGTVVSYLHQAAIVLVGLWLTPFLLNRIGQREYGLWLVVGQLLGYLALLDLGVLAILPREVAFASGVPGSVSSADRIAGLMAHVRRIVRWQMLGLVVVSAAIWWFLPLQWRPLKQPLVLIFAAFLALYPFRVVLAALQGAQELPFLAKSQMAGWALGTVTTVGLVFARTGLYAVVAGWVVAQAVPALGAWWRARSLWPARSVTTTSHPTTRQYFRRSIWVSAGQIAQVLLGGSDILLLGQVLGPAAIVPYTCTGKLVTVFANHPQLLMHAAQPALSELRASASRERLASVATALTQTMLMLSGAILIVILPANHFFVNWWVGPEQYGGWWLTVALCTAMLLRHWNVATVYTLFCFGYERQLSLTSLADGVVTVLSTLLCVWQWGAVGAAIGSMIGAAAVSLPLNVRSVAREMNLSVFAFLRPIAPVLALIALITSAELIGAQWFPAPSLRNVLVVGAPAGLVYLAVIVPFAWRGPVGPYLRMMVPALERFTLQPVPEPVLGERRRAS